MTESHHWANFFRPVMAAVPVMVRDIVARPRRRRSNGPRALTTHECAAVLTKAGWTPAGAGPNYICVYFNKGEHRIALIVAPGDPITLGSLRETVAEFRQTEFAAGRRAVAVYQHGLAFGVAEEAAGQDITLIRFDGLAALEQALHATAAAAASRQKQELVALTRAYDGPVAAPMRTAGEAAPAGPLFETEQVACFVRDRGGDTLLITFANQWLRHDGRAFWADGLASTLGLSVVGFVAKEPCWYPPDDMAALLPAALGWIGGRFPERITYGHSQGGYAAIKFAAALGARLALAFSPQYAIDRRLVPDDRVNKYYTGQRHAGMAPTEADAALHSFVFYDPYDGADAAHAAAIGAALPALAVTVKFAGHATDRGLASAERFAQMLATARLGDRAAMQRFVAQQRATRVDRPVQMALALAGSRPRTAAAIVEKYADGWKTDQIGSACYRLAKAGQARLALGPALRAAEGAPDQANAQGNAALIALEARDLKLALGLVERALALDPYNPKWRDVDKRARGLLMAQAVPVAL